LEFTAQAALIEGESFTAVAAEGEIRAEVHHGRERNRKWRKKAGKERAIG